MVISVQVQGRAPFHNSVAIRVHIQQSFAGSHEQEGADLYSSCSFWRSALKSPIMSFSFFFSAAVMAVRVRSLLDPTPHPCMRA